MLPKTSRLTSAEVRAILKDGRSARAGTLSAKFIAKTPRKAAVVVKSSVAKTAVSRNSLRRAAYAALADALPPRIQLVLFLQKPSFNPTEFAELCSKLS